MYRGVGDAVNERALKNADAAPLPVRANSGSREFGADVSARSGGLIDPRNRTPDPRLSVAAFVE